MPQEMAEQRPIVVFDGQYDRWSPFVVARTELEWRQHDPWMSLWNEPEETLWWAKKVQRATTVLLRNPKSAEDAKFLQRGRSIATRLIERSGDGLELQSRLGNFMAELQAGKGGALGIYKGDVMIGDYWYSITEAPEGYDDDEVILADYEEHLPPKGYLEYYGNQESTPELSDMSTEWPIPPGHDQLLETIGGSLPEGVQRLVTVPTGDAASCDDETIRKVNLAPDYRKFDKLFPPDVPAQSTTLLPLPKTHNLHELDVIPIEDFSDDSDASEDEEDEDKTRLWDLRKHVDILKWRNRRE